MGKRWVEKEQALLIELKQLLKDDLSNHPLYPDIIGDRRLIRFLRGNQWNAQKSAKAFQNFLQWRKENNVDQIRNEILYGGVDHPSKFPNGEIILDILPQIVISTNHLDNRNQPVSLDVYGFDPNYVLDRITVAQYMVFLIYCLEFRALILEEMDEKNEAEYLQQNPDPSTRKDGYGFVTGLCQLRDLNGVGFKHLGPKSQSIIAKALTLAIPNYPEYLGKSYMVNTPWIFDTAWGFIKGFLDDALIAKIAIIGTNFYDTLLQELPEESIPVMLGGKLSMVNESYSFATKPGELFDPQNILHVDNVKKLLSSGKALSQSPSLADRKNLSSKGATQTSSSSKLMTSSTSSASTSSNTSTSLRTSKSIVVDANAASQTTTTTLATTTATATEVPKSEVSRSVLTVNSTKISVPFLQSSSSSFLQPLVRFLPSPILLLLVSSVLGLTAVECHATASLLLLVTVVYSIFLGVAFAR